MNRTIEERAVDWRKSINGSMEHEYGYEKGATEQRVLDTDKACKEFENFLNMKVGTTTIRKEDIPYWIKEFRNKIL